MRKLQSLLPPLRLRRISWGDLWLVLGPMLVLVGVGFWVAIHFVKPEPPRELRLGAGPERSSFHTAALHFRDVLARDGITVHVIATRGGSDNLQRLSSAQGGLDAGLLQSGLAAEQETSGLVSLGSLFYEPVWILVRGHTADGTLAALAGRRIAVGAPGSGTWVFSQRLLAANGIDGHNAVLRELDNEDAVRALRAGEVDVVFLLGDSATPVVRDGLAIPGVAPLGLSQADGYVRRFPYLYRLVLPRGVLDLGRDRPPADVVMVGPTAELIARDELHPALSDLLIEAAQEIFGGPGIFDRAGEFPAPREHDFELSEDAARFYKSGRTFLRRHLPFWAANLADRALVLLVPLVALVLPAVRTAPALYRWRLRTRLYRWYGQLMAVERDAMAQPGPEQRQAIAGRLDRIEDAVNQARLPMSFADQVYVLRQHIDYVREQLKVAV